MATTVQSLLILARHLVASVRRFTVLEMAMLVAAVLATITFGISALIAGEIGFVLTLSLWMFVAFMTAVFVVLSALDRLADIDLTTAYLKTFQGEHVYESGDGKRWTFQSGVGWRKVAAAA